MEPVYSLKMRLPQKHIFTYVPVSLLKASHAPYVLMSEL